MKTIYKLYDLKFVSCTKKEFDNLLTNEIRDDCAYIINDEGKITIHLNSAEEKLRNWLPLHRDSGKESFAQSQDDSYTGIKIKTKNPDAYKLDNTLTDNEIIGSLGDYSTSFGGNTQAKGKRAMSTGTGTLAKGNYSHSEGSDSVALGSASHVEGYRNTTGPNADSAHAEGGENVVTSNRGHAEGYHNTVSGTDAHAEGGNNTASGEQSHAEGLENISSGDYSHAEGQQTRAQGIHSHSEGTYTKAIGNISHAEGNRNEVHSVAAHIEGSGNKILTTISSSDTPGTGSGGSPFDPNFKIDEHRGDNSHVEGAQNLMYGYTAHAEGTKNIVKGHYAHAEGINNTITIDAEASHVEGNSNNVTSKYSHTEGYNNTNNGLHAHVEGYNNTTKSQSTHIEGENNTIENSTWAHVEGCNNSISNGASAAHVEGSNNDARGVSAHAEGASTKAWGAQSHSGGYDTVADGDYSFVHGISSSTIGEASSAFGQNNIAGCLGFKVSNFVKGTSTEGAKVTLNTDATHFANIEVGDLVSVKINYNATGLKVTAIDTTNKVVTLDYKLSTFPDFVASDDDYLWLVEKPEAGDTSIGIGAFAGGFKGNQANQDGSLALGRDNIADGRFSVALGTGNKAGYNTFTFGKNNNALHAESTSVFGTSNTIENCYGGLFAGKSNNVLTQSDTFVLGSNNSLAKNGGNNFILGSNNSLAENSSNTVLLGNHLKTLKGYCYYVGQWNKPVTDITDPERFSVGIGDSEGSRKNGFTIYQSGYGEIYSQGTTNKSIVQKQYVDNVANNKQDKFADYSKTNGFIIYKNLTLGDKEALVIRGQDDEDAKLELEPSVISISGKQIRINPISTFSIENIFEMHVQNDGDISVFSIGGSNDTVGEIYFTGYNRFGTSGITLQGNVENVATTGLNVNKNNIKLISWAYGISTNNAPLLGVSDPVIEANADKGITTDDLPYQAVNKKYVDTNFQAKLVSGTNIKSIKDDKTEAQSLLGSDSLSFKTINNQSLLGSGNITIEGGSGGSTITVDDTISDTSTNPVQNKVINAALDKKQDKLYLKAIDDGAYELSISPVESTKHIVLDTHAGVVSTAFITDLSSLAFYSSDTKKPRMGYNSDLKALKLYDFNDSNEPPICLTGIADGTNNNDAVNVSQLNKKQDKLTSTTDLAIRSVTASNVSTKLLQSGTDALQIVGSQIKLANNNNAAIKITNLADGTATSDAVNKGQLNAAVANKQDTFSTVTTTADETTLTADKPINITTNKYSMVYDDTNEAIKITFA